MKRMQLLQTLQEREVRRRDEAHAAVGVAIGQAQAHRQQAESLTTYRDDYCRKWSTNFRQAAPMAIVLSYHGFLARLDQAILQQQAVVAHAQRGVDAARQRLLEREIRVATVERLVKRRNDLLRRQDERRDQKNLDEFAQRRAPSRDRAALS